MYTEVKSSLKKHLDFIVLDLLCMEIGFIIAYYLRHKNFQCLIDSEYKSMLFVILFANIITCYVFNTMQDVLKRSGQLEFYATLKQVFLTSFILLAFIFLTRTGMELSRQTIILFPIIYFILSYVFRLVYKKIIRNFIRNTANRKIVIITTKDRVDEILLKYNKNVSEVSLKGIVIIDADMLGSKVEIVVGDEKKYYDVVSNKENVIRYLLQEYVDEVFVCISGQNEYKKELIKKINEMGIVLHIEIDYVDSIVGQNNKEFIEHLFDYTVMTCTVNTISSLQIITKRVIDIISGIVGCIFTLIFAIIIGPIIKIKSPGPIFFSQDRIGKNGKVFKIYKFRSMHINAEEMKKDLMKRNEQNSDLMFKIEEDPRIIKGIGHFIRNHSIDEFPQFLNVLIGDMSLVGTRPPTKDEWEKYDLHHRARLAIKPGITGLWQVSGRSNIKDFEEVVKLDTYYIKNFSIWLDMKIILETFKVMITKNGAK